MALKTQNGRFPGEICYKVSLCKNCQGQSCRAFIGVTNRAKMIGGDVPLSKRILGAAAVLSQIVTNGLFAPQLLQWNIKFLTLFIY